MKRLFFFAAYDPGNVIPQSDLHYIKALSGLGDVVFCADNNLDADQMDKVAPLVLHAEAEDHGEYDFGSYKRCWNWAKSALDLNAYDFIYLTNDSVAGPFRPLGPVLEKLENGADATGMCLCPKHNATHIQSWFVGLSKKVFFSEAFDSFMQSVCRESDKNQIYTKYENGLTAMLDSLACKTATLLTVPGKGIYNRVDSLFKAGLPFVKKSSFIRHNGSLGRRINYVLVHCREYVGDDAAALYSAVGADLDRLYGKDYLANLISAGCCETLRRYLKYLSGKIF